MGEDIEKCIRDILSKKLLFDEKYLTPSNYEEPLTGSLFRLQAEEMIYLFYELERALHRSIDAHLVLNYQFNTINGIIRALSKTA